MERRSVSKLAKKVADEHYQLSQVHLKKLIGQILPLAQEAFSVLTKSQVRSAAYHLIDLVEYFHYADKHALREISKEISIEFQGVSKSMHELLSRIGKLSNSLRDVRYVSAESVPDSRHYEARFQSVLKDLNRHIPVALHILQPAKKYVYDLEELFTYFDRVDQRTATEIMYITQYLESSLAHLDELVKLLEKPALKLFLTSQSFSN